MKSRTERLCIRLENGGLILNTTSYGRMREDAAFCAAARTYLPKLIAVVEAARSVSSEEAVREQLLCYNMGCALLARLAALESE